jgi:acyl-CoA reductase-like NAD-dependent aldehyde dehydrogenase
MTSSSKEGISELCRSALEAEDGWRDGSPEQRIAAYHRFQDLVRSIAALTDRSYEEVMNDAIEEWVRVHFCEVGAEVSAEEWLGAGR